MYALRSLTLWFTHSMAFLCVLGNWCVLCFPRTFLHTLATQVGVEICKRAEHLGAYMVVMAKHTRGPLQQLLLGSATLYCLKHCRVPVLVLHVD